jgi:hypothetical protein
MRGLIGLLVQLAIGGLLRAIVRNKRELIGTQSTVEAWMHRSNLVFATTLGVEGGHREGRNITLGLRDFTDPFFGNLVYSDD